MRREDQPEAPKKDSQTEDLESLSLSLKAVDSRDLDAALHEMAVKTGVNPEFLRQALGSVSETVPEMGFWMRFRRQIARISESTKRLMISSFLGLQSSLIAVLGIVFGDPYGIGLMSQIILSLIALYNVAYSRRGELGAFVGGSFAATYMIGKGFFSLLLQSPMKMEGALIIPFTLLGALIGYIIGKYGESLILLRFRHDPQKRREYLLRQLVELQEELKQNEQLVTFLSIDVVGSTGMKQDNDSLAVEFSFGEYHNFIKESVSAFGGEIHSTAGDGVIIAFRHPQHAFQAARRILSGMIEFNLFRNKLNRPFEIRCGLHTGNVITSSQVLTDVNYSHVLDVASHMQQAASPGTIVISEDTAVYLPKSIVTFSEESIQVAGIRAVIWRPQVSIEQSQLVEKPPPLPPSVTG